MDLGPADGFRTHLRLRPIQRSFTLAGGSVHDDKTQPSTLFSTYPEGEGGILPDRLMPSMYQGLGVSHCRF